LSRGRERVAIRGRTGRICTTEWPCQCRCWECQHSARRQYRRGSASCGGNLWRKGRPGGCSRESCRCKRHTRDRMHHSTGARDHHSNLKRRRPARSEPPLCARRCFGAYQAPTLGVCLGWCGVRSIEVTESQQGVWSCTTGRVGCARARPGAFHLRLREAQAE
jgi:hypothetical protein